jgi:hypothetical protein
MVSIIRQTYWIEKDLMLVWEKFVYKLEQIVIITLTSTQLGVNNYSRYVITTLITIERALADYLMGLYPSNKVAENTKQGRSKYINHTSFFNNTTHQSQTESKLLPFGNFNGESLCF